jgi:maltose alpha-D-glucosyltransferase/alpha-amylase
MLRFFELERVVYELDYELNNRPEWIDIPLRGLLAIGTRAQP